MPSLADLFYMINALVVATCNSLWPAIALLVLVDLNSGIVAWLALREGQARAGEEE